MFTLIFTCPKLVILWNKNKKNQDKNIKTKKQTKLAEQFRKKKLSSNKKQNLRINFKMIIDS